ncbi:hypothetical protein CF327_g875 [Tilletia walkeri]|uniref:F-box domain-containing protein n=1 Tax=Tilletia walkeri TaxID=117179 RepID=A0A8X7NH58_9BASI|nr:hypothetical protein CF327_g875 [Tilletia walkeri]KAE8272070.1 hypothetical protein A4X09_0g275 [Tilletia walkeri]
MSTPSQAATDAAAAVVAQQAQELSLNTGVATTSPTTSSPSSSVFPFLALPAELIKSFLEQCDNSTLLKLRGVARKFKTIIDEDVNLDQFPFRYRPLFNPPLNQDEFKEIWYCEKGQKARGEVSPFEPPYARFIVVNPALKRLHWSEEDGWNEARLGSRLRAGDDPHSAYELSDWSVKEGERHLQLVSRFKVKDFPMLLDETATWPPVSSLDVTIQFLTSSKPFVNTIIGQKENDEQQRISASATEAEVDVQHQLPPPVLVRDVIGALADLARQCDHIWPDDDPCRGAQDERVPLRLDNPPLLEAGCEDTQFSLVFEHYEYMDMSHLDHISPGPDGNFGGGCTPQ